MSINKERPHVLILPEDDANRQLANGFAGGVSRKQCIQVLSEAGGWRRVLAVYHANWEASLRRHPDRHIVLIIDFDGQIDRLGQARSGIEPEVANRVYIVGARDEPENLKRAIGWSWERIGRQLAEDCAQNVPGLWNHSMLAHNQAEVDRLRNSVRAILF